MNSVLARASALLTTGLLAGAFLYGWAIVVPTFGAVPLDVHLAFRTTLMRSNAPVMQTLMVAALLASAWYAVTLRGRARAAAWGAAALAATSLLVTRFGNVPINLQIKAWAAGSPPADHADRLRLWDRFNDARVAAAVGALVLLVVAVDLSRARPGPAEGAGLPAAEPVVGTGPPTGFLADLRRRSARPGPRRVLVPVLATAVVVALHLALGAVLVGSARWVGTLGGTVLVLAATKLLVVAAVALRTRRGPGRGGTPR